jgi:hypothetical protein
MITKRLKYESYLSKYSLKPLVSPPAGRGYSSTTNCKINQHGSGIKLKNAILTQVCRNV